MSTGAQSGNFKNFPNVPPGQLKHEIEEKFDGAAPGEYYALVVKVENPITGYQVIKVPVPA